MGSGYELPAVNAHLAQSEDVSNELDKVINHLAELSVRRSSSLSAAEPSSPVNRPTALEIPLPLLTLLKVPLLPLSPSELPPLHESEWVQIGLVVTFSIRSCATQLSSSSFHSYNVVHSQCRCRHLLLPLPHPFSHRVRRQLEGMEDQDAARN